MFSTQQLRLIGQPVRSLQTMLRALSFQYPFLPRLTPDGVFGEPTLEAVMLFQREFFPPVTGRVNQATWDAIAALYLQTLARQALPLRSYPGGEYSVPPEGDSAPLAPGVGGTAPDRCPGPGQLEHPQPAVYPVCHLRAEIEVRAHSVRPYDISFTQNRVLSRTHCPNPQIRARSLRFFENIPHHPGDHFSGSPEFFASPGNIFAQREN